MSRLDETLRPMAARLLARAGTVMVLRYAGQPAYDPATGTVAETPADRTVVGVIEAVETGHADGVVRRGDVIVTIAAEPLPVDPSPGDGLLIDSVLHRILSVTLTWAGDRPALFRLHARR